MALVPGVLNGGVILTGPSADGSSGQALVTNASGALSFGSFQATDADLTAIAALGYTSGSYLIKKTAANTYALITVTTAGEALLDDATAADQLTTLGAAAGAASSTDNALARFDGTTGKTVQNSALIVEDTTGVLHTPDASGSNTAATVHTKIAPPRSTGNATPASVIIQTTVAGSSGSDPQTLSDTFYATNGRIGVGASPSSSYFVDIRSSGSYPRLNIETTSPSDGGGLRLASASASAIIQMDAGDIDFFNGGDWLRIKAAGTVVATKCFATTPQTPSQITSNQNNYAPTSAGILRLSTDASRDITGLSISQVSGMRTEIWNVGAQNIVLKHADSNSTAANQFTNSTGADITLAAGEEASLKYDGVTSRWRVRKIS